MAMTGRWADRCDRNVARRRAFSLIGVTFLVGALLSGCGGEDQSATGTPTGQMSPTPVRPPVFGTPVWTQDVDPATNQPLQPVTTFPDTVSRLSVAVPVERLPPSTSVTSTWFFNDVELSGLGTEITIDRGIERGWIEVHLDRQTEEVWPDGRYRVVLSIGGTTLADTAIDVERT